MDQRLVFTVALHEWTEDGDVDRMDEGFRQSLKVLQRLARQGWTPVIPATFARAPGRR